MKRTGITLTKELLEEGKSFAEKGTNHLYTGNVYKRGLLLSIENLSRNRIYSADDSIDGFLELYSYVGSTLISGTIELKNFEIIEINEK